MLSVHNSQKLNMYKSLILVVALTFSACHTNSEKTENVKITVADKDSAKKVVSDSSILKTNLSPCINDSLNALANLMSGISDSNAIYNYVQSTGSFKSFSANFNKRWISFDSTRLTNLRTFRENEISKVVKKQTLVA